MGSVATYRVAVLVNHPPNTTFWPEVKQAFVDSFVAIAEDVQIQFYDPIVLGQYPDPRAYDLLILSGGKADASASDPWILRMIEYVRETVVECPQTKMLGICWGHQLIARALGGTVQAVPSGPIAGLTEVKLTEQGRNFFPTLAQKGSYLASQFHVREVSKPAPGFIALAENNEAFLSETNTILSFQAHPEIDGIFAKKILDDGDPTYVESVSPEEVQQIKDHCADKQDGLVMLERVVKWMGE